MRSDPFLFVIILAVGLIALIFAVSRYRYIRDMVRKEIQENASVMRDTIPEKEQS